MNQFLKLKKQFSQTKNKNNFKTKTLLKKMNSL